MKTNKSIIGVLAAAAIGTALGLLFAPDNGKNTRQKIAKKSAKKADELKEKIDNLKESLNNKYQNVLHKGEQMVENGQEEINNIKKINKEVL
ncbi:YtxH domain-containing protein [Flavobacterium sp. 7A]|uniref:YtxH domain-containing protein n=1 Tax=Flavobacterium sp. 7A TaxID=2940571 RepID=UPI002227B58F|nr:YtxH domain-containing protein [Flavobacterium sp. 7A]MCW2118942.1 gas vesicle protein [Flavobacterium sp. 7A]